jgi:hypothetical protein
MKTISLFFFVVVILFCNIGCNKISTSSTPLGNTNSASSISNKPAGGSALLLSSGPLLGKWQEKAAGGQTLEFKPDGTLTINYYSKTFNDSYSYTSSSQIKDTDAKGETRYPGFTVKGDEMTLTWPDATVESLKNQRFVRVK